MTDNGTQGVEIKGPQLNGTVCVTTYGSIKGDTTACLLNLQKHICELGIKTVEIHLQPGALVDKARNDACQRMLDEGKEWLIFIDGDMVFNPQVFDLLITTAYHTHPEVGVVGGYANLRGPPYLPTIDTGTGTWEPHPAGIGVINVIRTGAACILIKRQVLEKMGFPWFGIRNALDPLQAMQEVDGYARQNLDNRNPFANLPEWQALLNKAVQQGRTRPGSITVGEDSGFCDRAKALGVEIVVNTDAVFHHLETKPIGPNDHTKAYKEVQDLHRAACGVTIGL